MTATVEGATRYLLPPQAYFSATWYQRGIEQVFAQNWGLVGYLADLPAAGTWTTGYCGPIAVATVLQEDGSLRAFADPTGSSLLPEFDSAGLAGCAVGTWRGLIFAHLRPESAPDLMTWLDGFAGEAFIGDFPLEELAEVYRVQWDLKCNWKFYIENHIDIYHLWYLHDESLGMYDHHGLTHLSAGPHWSCVEGAKDGDGSRRGSLPRIPGVSDAEARLVRANLIFPNVPWSSSSGNSVNTYQVIPTGPETCRLDLRMRAVPGSVVSEEDLASGKLILYSEDGFACEQMQRVVHSPRFVVGPLAQTYEQPIMTFHQNLLELLEASPVGVVERSAR
jgi:phenylpropionate dioxygenase-like ring-hydroxylating dioxygenase large terminal subunit